MNVSRRTTLRALASFASLPLSALPVFSAEPPRRFRLIVLDVGGTIIQDRGDVGNPGQAKHFLILTGTFDAPGGGT